MNFINSVWKRHCMNDTGHWQGDAMQFVYGTSSSRFWRHKMFKLPFEVIFTGFSIAHKNTTHSSRLGSANQTSSHRGKGQEKEAELDHIWRSLWTRTGDHEMTRKIPKSRIKYWKLGELRMPMTRCEESEILYRRKWSPSRRRVSKSATSRDLWPRP